MKMFNPPHPGEILKLDYIEPLNLTITDCSKAIDTTRKNLSEIINGKIGISAAMAIKLAKAFSTSPEYWMNLQLQYDLFQAEQSAKLDRIEVLYIPETSTPSQQPAPNYLSSTDPSDYSIMSERSATLLHIGKARHTASKKVKLGMVLKIKGCCSK